MSSAPPPPPPGFVPVGSAAQPAAAAPQPDSDLTANPNGEGTYQMQGPGGMVGVPYSKVEGAKAKGYDFPRSQVSVGGKPLTLSPEETRYEKDARWSAGGLLNTAASAYGALHGPVEMGEAKGAAQTVAGILNILGKADREMQHGGAVARGEENGDVDPNAAQNPQPNPLADHMQNAARFINDNAHEDGLLEQLGGFGENIGELLTPEALAALGKTAEIAKGAKAAGAGEKIAGAIQGAAEKYADASKVAKILKTYPKIASLVGLGAATAARGAAETGAQTYVKTGGDTDAAMNAAEIGGVLGGAGAPLLKGAGDAVAERLAKRAATKEMVGGVETVIPAEVRNVKPTPQQVSGQQSIRNAAQDTLAQRLQEVNESRAVPEETQPLLPARTGPFTFKLKTGEPVSRAEGESSLQTPRARQIGTRVVAGKGSGTAPTEGVHISAFTHPTVGDNAPLPQISDLGEQPSGSHKEPILQYSADSKPGSPPAKTDVLGGGGQFQTQDPNIVREHIRNINNVVDSPDFERMPPEQQQALLDARTDAQNQLGQYHRQVTDSIRAGRPNLPQIDIPTTIKKVGSYTDAARHLENIATDGYNSISDALNLNDISGGKFNAIRNANKEAWSAYKAATTPEALRAAEQTIDSTNQQMTDMLANDIHGAVTPKELAGFNDAYAASQRLKYVANAVDRAFSGNDSAAARSWEYRGFNGTQLMSNLDRLTSKFGRPSLERVVGKANLDTLYQVAELNRSNAARARFGAAVKPVADALIKLHAGPIALGGYLGHVTGVGYEAGAAAGAILPEATKRVMNAVLSNPNVAQNLIFAIKAGARPENYGPMIAAMIQRSETEQAKQNEQEKVLQ